MSRADEADGGVSGSCGKVTTELTHCRECGRRLLFHLPFGGVVPTTEKLCQTCWKGLREANQTEAPYFVEWLKNATPANEAAQAWMQKWKEPN